MGRWLCALFFCVAPLIACRASAASLNLINAERSFTDAAGWLYETPAHTFGFSEPLKGTNERIDVLPPNIPSGMEAAGIELLRHQMDFHGYPLHISLVDKLFAQKQNVEMLAFMGSDRREYDPGTPFGKEKILQGGGTESYTVDGPIPASSDIPSTYSEPFAFVKDVLAQLNLPVNQKDLTNYAVMFVETKDITWVELAPVWGNGETPHLGCQTAVGRDMVFGYVKKAPSGYSGGPFLQCL